MNERDLHVWTAVAGVATVLTTIVAIGILLASGPPAAGDSPQVVAQFFTDHPNDVLAAVFLASLSLGFNLVFYFLLREVLRRAAPESEAMATLGAVAGAVFIAVIYAGFAVLAQLAYRAGASDAQTQRTLFDIYELTLTMSGVPTAVSVAAISVVVLRGRLFPGWLAWYGFAVAAVHVVSSGSYARSGVFTPANFAGTIAPLAFEIWVLALSAVLLSTPRAVREAHPAAAQAN